MKRGLKVLTSLMFFCVIGLPLFAQPSSKSVETFVIDNFDSVGEQNYMYNGVTYSWDWSVNTSRFVAEGYQKQGYYEGIPNSLKLLRRGNDTPAKVLGVQTAFNRKGDNWFEVYPVVDGKPFEVPFVGTVTQVDFWVWGANYKYVLELMVRDADGRVNVLRATDLSFNGWRNVIVNIPSSIRQQSRLRSGPQNLTVVGFRVRSDPSEYVDDFMIFFDQLKYTSHTLNNIFDGFELKYADFGEQDSSYSSNSSSSGPSVDAK